MGTVENQSLLYFIKTYGCQMNVNDSEFIEGQLEAMGYKLTKDMNLADIVILNTCCVRKQVEEKIYSTAGIIQQIKNIRPDLIFIICGCLAQKEKENFIKRIPMVDMILGPSQASSFAMLLNEYLEKREKLVVCNNKIPFNLKGIPIKYSHPIKAYVQIMKGCNNFCSYCVVPYTRGPEESRPTEEILAEIRHLVDHHYKEILLLGQNVNSFGNHSANHDSFLTLLNKVNKIEGIERVRFITSHPKDFHLDLIQVIKESKKICEHIHLPLQSGSDRILKKMNRQYDMQQYYTIINHIRKQIPDASITTDVMVGFPGETEGDFERTMQAFKNIQYDSAYTFIYSNRENTLSSLFNNQIDLSVKKQRLWRLIDLQRRISAIKNKAMAGQIVEILVEDKSKKGIDNQFWGKTRTNKVAVFNAENGSSDNDYLIGQLVNIKIIDADAYTLFGEFINVKTK
ncbi:MAG: tRNA (N6-isopentenyl adenosine(37)-C2)-methylthiotransferase MiaB [Candidatus Lokiarchaeota archaeon]|nr:tRNA (N6-isopentenyl adenosine(37)-C2)-methylthiotransferase MiaB [Candidatus Lokiarchaeota archaeon]